MDYNIQQYRIKENESKESSENIKQTIEVQDSSVNAIEPIYVMTVELEEGSSQSIKIYADSTPEELAFEFCKKNNLDINAMKYLTEQIKNLLEELNNENMENAQLQENHNILENECIQEVDEEEIGSDTRKTSKTINHFNNNAAATFNVKENKTNTYKAGLLLDSLNASQNVVQSAVEDEDNQIIDTKELMEEDEDSKKKEQKYNQLNEHNQLNEQNNPKKPLFYFDALKNKEKSQDEISRSGKSTNKTPVKQISKVFDRLYRNTEQKKFGAYSAKYNANRNDYSSNKNEHPKFTNTTELCQYIQRGKSAEISKRRPTYREGEVINFGERLYQKGIKLKEEQMKKVEYLKREMRLNQANIYTYKPRINDVDPEVIKKRVESLPYNKEEYILKYNDFLQEKIERLRKKHGADIEYSFTPAINSNSEKMANEKIMNKILNKSTGSSPDPHQQRINDLYEAARLKQMRMNIRSKLYHDQYIYQPLTNDNSRYNGNGFLNLNFDQRQEICRKRSEDKKKHLKDVSLLPVDKNTGQNFFQPQLVSKSKEKDQDVSNNNLNNNNSRQHTSTIFQSLYSYAQKYSKNKKERENNNNSAIIRYSQSVHTGNDSEYLFYKKKEEVFKSIFKILDSDQDDLVSTLNIDIKKLPNKIKTILNPIFIELKEENETLNELEFIRACEHLYEVLFANLVA
jgi:hypothetical protein